MTKKHNLEKDTEHNEYFNYKIELIFGTWKKLFDEHKIKLLIAEALNEWTIAQPLKFKLNGYLITNDNLYIILESEKSNEEKLLSFFFEHVKRKIYHFFHTSKKGSIENNEPLDLNIFDQNLFRKKQFFNHDLIGLITGKKVESVYENWKLIRLKHIIRNYIYCSAIDYKGGKGPVIVTLK